MDPSIDIESWASGNIIVETADLDENLIALVLCIKVHVCWLTVVMKHWKAQSKGQVGEFA